MLYPARQRLNIFLHDNCTAECILAAMRATQATIHQCSIDIKPASPHLNRLARQADNTLNIIHRRTTRQLKDNHITAAGSITEAVAKVERYLKRNKKALDMTVEVRNMKELKEVLALKKSTPRVMLDNFEVEQMKKAVKLVNKRLEVEASGGIKLNNVKAVAATGVDFVSVGALTHSARSLDLSLKIID